MANIASGLVIIKSKDKKFLNDLKTKISEGPFSYSEPADIAINVDSLEVNFTGRWSCASAWDFLDELISNKKYLYQKQFIDSVITGTGDESSLNYHERVSKGKGQSLLTREDIAEDVDFWGALSKAVPMLPKVGKSITIGAYVNITVVSHKKTQYELSIDFQCQHVDCTFTVDKEGIVEGRQYSDEDEDNNSPEDSSYCGEMIQDILDEFTNVADAAVDADA